MKKPATWKFITLVVLLMALGGGGTYWVQSSRLKAQFAVRVLERPVEVGDGGVVDIETLEQRIRTGDALAVGELGKLYRANQRFEPALACYLTMVELDPTNSLWPLEVATMELALGNKREAKMRVTRIRMEGFPDGESYWRLGNLAEALGEQVDAKQDYEQAVALDPSLVETWSRLITMYQLTGRTREARAAFETALEANPYSLELLLHRASFRVDNKQFEPALADLKRVMVVAPDSPIGYLRSSQLLIQLGREHEAEGLLESLVDRDEHNLEALQQLVILSVKEGDRASSDHWLRQIVSQTADGKLASVLGEAVASAIERGYASEFGEPPLE